jgi:hypothetical protein
MNLADRNRIVANAIVSVMTDRHDSAETLTDRRLALARRAA